MEVSINSGALLPQTIRRRIYSRVCSLRCSDFPGQAAGGRWQRTHPTHHKTSGRKQTDEIALAHVVAHMKVTLNNMTGECFTFAQTCA
jgi:hypothetical protein